MSFANLHKFTSFSILESESGTTIFPIIEVENVGFFQSLEDLERVFFLTDELSEHDCLLEACEDSFRAFKWIRQAIALCVLDDTSDIFYPSDNDVSEVNEVDELLSMKISDMIDSHQNNNLL
jgi:hypothetical protein